MSDRWRNTLVVTLAGLLIALVGMIAWFVERVKSVRNLEAEHQARLAEREARQADLEALQRVLERQRDPGNRDTVELDSQSRTTLESLKAGVAYLLGQQSPDGAWRSDLYATFKDGSALTPLVVAALQEAGHLYENQAIRKGSEYLASLVNADGSIKGGNGDIDYPVYTAALSVIALSHADNKDLLKARDAWLKYLLDRQLTEKLDWKPEDKQYGGWGYCRLIPRRPEPNIVAPPLIESNLSATVFALEALRAAGVAEKDRYESAAVFVRRCQNEDGGFHFIYDDPVRNKAGARSLDTPLRFHSYGSTTADGVRASFVTESFLHRLQDETAKPGIVARVNPTPMIRGYQWLEKNFRADTHPGKYIPAHERNREAVYYYYVAAVSKALRLMKAERLGDVDWAKDLTDSLVKRQNKDGSWANPADLVRENEPLVATANAVIALANCRQAKK